MIKAAIIGDGYTAADLLRLLAGRDEVKVEIITSTENTGRKISQVYPHLDGFYDLTLAATDLHQIKQSCQVAFLALPHGLSVPMVQELVSSGVRCIDLGADFRLKDAAVYEKYYETVHAAPYLLADAVYGLPELYRDKIRQASIVANPGCYPTSAILPLAPLLNSGVLESQGIIIDSKSGVTGAGKSPKPSSHFCEVNEGIKAYGVGDHRHGPEIAQELSLAAGTKVEMIFTPHLVPMNRGILSTIYARLRPGARLSQVRSVLEEFYGAEPFVRILPEGVFPHTKWVYGTNFLDVGVHVNEASGQVILISALDNLTKGASGQAIQNLNIMFGLPETRGLFFPGVHP
ncbi:MAG TPA: N-acetyl-gamma-glutamyl-phosphate reductase [Syntrophomonadaceae bacterium]|nr:N-acetyl-gamma-glutamyl-phosphate reductase [Syntrophomonadaceae bacterium]